MITCACGEVVAELIDHNVTRLDDGGIEWFDRNKNSITHRCKGASGPLLIVDGAPTVRGNLIRP